MSTQRGAGPKRDRPQKHKNTFAFKNDLHDKTWQMKKINSLYVCEVCERCKLQIEWKIKYKKYKPLSQAKTCIKCSQRTVKKAYHVCCQPCARAEKICAKCLTSADQVNIEPPEPSPEEQVQLKVDMDRLIKSLPERKRRTFLRFMKKGKPIENEVKGEAGAEDGEGAEVKEASEETDAKEEKRNRKKFVPHNRAELMDKFESLKLAEDEEDFDFLIGSDSEADSDGSEYWDVPDDDEEAG